MSRSSIPKNREIPQNRKNSLCRRISREIDGAFPNARRSHTSPVARFFRRNFHRFSTAEIFPRVPGNVKNSSICFVPRKMLSAIGARARLTSKIHFPGNAFRICGKSGIITIVSPMLPSCSSTTDSSLRPRSRKARFARTSKFSARRPIRQPRRSRKSDKRCFRFSFVGNGRSCISRSRIFSLRKNAP